MSEKSNYIVYGGIAAVILLIWGGNSYWEWHEESKAQESIEACVAYLHEKKMGGYYCKPDIKCDLAGNCPTIGYRIAELTTGAKIFTTKGSCLQTVSWRASPYYRGFCMEHAACDGSNCETVWWYPVARRYFIHNIDGIRFKRGECIRTVRHLAVNNEIDGDLTYCRPSLSCDAQGKCAPWGYTIDYKPSLEVRDREGNTEHIPIEQAKKYRRRGFKVVQGAYLPKGRRVATK